MSYKRYRSDHFWAGFWIGAIAVGLVAAAVMAVVQSFMGWGL